MKKFTFLSLCFCCILWSFNASAQYCGNSGPNIGTPNRSITLEGFYPPDDSFPCAIMGVYYDTAIQAHTPSTATSGSSTYPLKYITVDTLNNLPCGLCWATDTFNNQIDENATRVVRFTGYTFDAPGLYVLHIIVSATVSVVGVPVTVHNENLSAQGLHFELRVRLPNDTCIAVDTLAAGNIASSDSPEHGTIATPSITGGTSICPGSGSTTLTATGGSYTAYAWSNGTFGTSISVSTPGAYTVSVYDNCSSATASVNVVNATITKPTITPNGATTFCGGGSVSLNAGAGYLSYLWSNNATSQSITATVAGNYACTVSENGCQAVSDTVAVTVNTSPTPTVTAGGPTSFCTGDSVLLNAGSAYSAYAWSNNATTQTIEALTTGNYKCTVTQNGCSGTSNTITVTVSSLSPAITSSGPLSFCTGGKDTLNAGSGYSSYLWSTTETTQTIVVTASGNYTCTVSQGSCQGVTNTVTITVGSGLSPVITANPSLNICPGASTTLDAGAGYTSYAWSNTTGNETTTVSSANTYIVTVSQGSCTGTASATVNVGNFPVSVSISPAGPISVCADSVVTLDAGAGFTTYTWSPGGSTSETIQPTTSGPYVVVVSKNFCVGADTVNVTFNPLPQPAITSPGPLSVCAGGVVTLDAGAGYAVYKWSNGTNTETTQVSTAEAYYVTVTNNNGCMGSDSAVVSVSSTTVPVIVGTGVTCGGQADTLSTSIPYAHYSWSTGDTTATVIVNTVGTYNVSVTTAGGCSGSSTTAYTYTFSALPSEYISQSQSSDTTTLLQVSPTGAGYQWLSQQQLGGPYTALGSTVETFTTSCSTTKVYYTAIVTQNGCNDTSRIIQVSCTPAGINDISSITDFTLKPNPASDVLNITYGLTEPTAVKISVIDLTGRVVIKVLDEAENSGNQQHQVRVNDLAPGIYIVSFDTNLGRLNSKFVKQ